jgi:hypothetical protein
MSVGIFTDKEHQPTREEVFGALGSQRLSWENLAQFIAANYGSQGDLRFYGKNYGWALRFRKGGKALLSLYPGQGSFTAQVVIGQSEVEKALSLSISDKVSKIIEDAHPFPEGRWLFIKVESEGDVKDIEQLITVKSRPAQQRKE